MNINLSKKEIRAKMKSIRNNIPNRLEREKDIQSQLFAFLKKENIDRLAIYISFDSEFNTKGIIKYCLLNNIKIYIPKINKEDELDFYLFDGNYSSLIKNKFSILEPNDNSSTLDNNIKYMIIPGLACDKQGYRIGYGKGYYDKYIKKHDTYKIGLYFKEQILNYIPHNEDDLCYDTIFSN
mgnify:FL=1